jgi:hypothetical protein
LSALIRDTVQSFAHPHFHRDGMDLASITRASAKGVKIGKGAMIQELKLAADDSVKRLRLMQKRNQQLKWKGADLIAKNQALTQLLTQQAGQDTPIKYRTESPVLCSEIDTVHTNVLLGVSKAYQSNAKEMHHEPLSLFSDLPLITDTETNEWWLDIV